MPIRNRRSHRATRKALALLSGVVAVSIIALAMWASVPRAPYRDSARSTTFDPAPNDALETALAGGLPDGDLMTVSAGRPVYRHSVVPGGTYTTAELRTAILTDPVVAAHYKDLDQSKLRVEHVTRDRYVHVSYRKGDEVYWTKNKVLLRQGETIITDGTTEIRARCGNCISEEPLLPTKDDEPDAVEFDRLVEPVAAAPVAPQVALIPPTSPLAIVPPAAALPGGTTSPLAAGRLGSGVPPLSAGTQNAGPPGPDVPGPPITPGPDSPTPPGNPPAGNPPPLDNPPPGNGPPPGTNPPPPGNPPRIPEGPPGGEPPPLVPPENYPPVSYPPPNGPPPVPPGPPVQVPEPGTMLLLGAGFATLLRRLRRKQRH